MENLHACPVAQLCLRQDSWYTLKGLIAWLRRFILFFQETCIKSRKITCPRGPLVVEEIANAGKCVMRISQRAHFKEDINTKIISKDSPLYQLQPFVDHDGLLKVSGRLHNAQLKEDTKHPIILPGRCEFHPNVKKSKKNAQQPSVSNEHSKITVNVTLRSGTETQCERNPVIETKSVKNKTKSVGNETKTVTNDTESVPVVLQSEVKIMKSTQITTPTARNVSNALPRNDGATSTSNPSHNNGTTTARNVSNASQENDGNLNTSSHTHNNESRTTAPVAAASSQTKIGQEHTFRCACI